VTRLRRERRGAGLGGLTLGAAVLRFATLGRQSFDHDEAVTAGRVLHPSLWHTLSVLPGSERTPPLYYALGWGWSRLFGVHEAGLRSLSALAGTLAVPLIFASGRRLVSARAGLAAALLAAVSPMLVYNGQDARAYSLGILLIALELLLFARALERPAAGRLAGWALAASLAAATHYFTLFVSAPMAVWLVVRHRSRRGPRVAVAALGLATVALAPLAYAQAVSKATVSFAEGGLPRRVAVTAAAFAVGENPPVPDASWLTVAFRATGVLVLGLAAGAVVLALRAPDDHAREGARLAFVVAAAGVLAPIGLAIVGLDFYNERNVVFALVPLLVVTAAGTARPDRRILGASLLGAVAALQLWVVVADVTASGLQRPAWRRLAGRIGRLRPDEAVVAPRTGDDPLAFYLHAARMPKAGSRVRMIRIVDYAPYSDGTPEAVRRPPAGFRATGPRRLGPFSLYALSSPRPRRISPDAVRREIAGADAVLVPPPDGGLAK
jgi:hypothetical protein